MHSTNPYKI